MSQQQQVGDIAGHIVVAGADPARVEEAIELIRLLQAIGTRDARSQITDLATQYSGILRPEVRECAIAARMAMIRPVSKKPEPESSPVTVVRFKRVVTTTVTEITVEAVNK